MRKIVPVAIVLAAIIALSGCASMLKAMGGVSKDELAAVNQQVSSLGSKIDATTKLAESKASVSQLDEIKASLAKLEELKADLALMKADLALIKATTDELAKTKAAVDALYAQVSKLTDDTLLKLASIIQQSLASTSAVPQVPAAAPAAAPAAEVPVVK
jgi:hypothetical protein